MNRPGRLFGVAALVLAVSAQAAALDRATPIAQYGRTSWTEADGLPSSLIWAIAQDQDGYLWLGTDAGLIRFDGVRFAHWNLLHRSRLPGDAVFGLLVARDGSLWIASGDGGVSRFSGGKLESFSPQEGSLPASVGQVLEDHEGTIWVGGRGGIARFRNNRWERAGIEEGLSKHSVSSLYEDRDQTIWVATYTGLFRRKRGQSKFELFPSPFVVRALAEDGSGEMWAVSPELAVGRISDWKLDKTFERWRDVNGWRILRDRQGNLWIATLGAGLLRVSALEKSEPARVQRLTVDEHLSSNVVRSLFEDREGNIWVGTQNGLNRLSDNAVTAISGGREISQPVRALTAAADGSIWVGTDNGIYRFSNDRRDRYGRQDGLASIVIGALHSDSRGVMWVAMDQAGLARFSNGRFVPEPIPRRSPVQRVSAMTSDHDGALWLCERDGGGVFRWKDGQLTALEDPPELKRKFGVSALTDREGRVWIGFSDGSLVVHDSGSFRWFTAGELPGGSVNAIYEDKDGAIWIGTGNGVSRYADGRLASLTAREGLPDSKVRAVVADQEGFLWIGISSGIIRVDPGKFDQAVTLPNHDLGYTLYDMFDGLPGVPMSPGGYPTAARARDGALWFLTSNGLAIVNPSRISKGRLSPPVRIEGVIADGHEVDTSSTARLPPLTSSLQIDFTALTFTAPAKVRFRYILEGFDRDWVDAGTRRQAFYTNLPPRNYTFRVIANNDGVWNDVGDAWAFSIQPAFYQTGWFYAVCAVSVIFAILAAWKVRARQARRRIAIVLGERTRMAREIHDTLLQSLVGIAFQFDTLSSELDVVPESAKARLARLRNQVETYVREARQSIWDLRSPTLRSKDLPMALRDLGEKITGKAVQLEFVVHGTPRAHEDRVEQALLRIGQEAISNAVRHAEATCIHVELAYRDEAIVLRVADDGHGFESATSSPTAEDHWGVTCMRERAEQIRAQFTLASGPNRGTTIEVTAPIAA